MCVGGRTVRVFSYAYACVYHVIKSMFEFQSRIPTDCLTDW